MRITNKMITAQYTRSLNNLSAELNRLNTQVASGRKFAKVSENTSAAIRAFQIRKDLSRTEGYQANVDHAMAFLTDTESALSHIEELMQNASSKIIYALNGSQSEEERKILATDLRHIQDQLLQTLNSNSSDSYHFGGTNTTSPPFEVVGGKLHYNGYALDLPLPADTPAANQALFASLEKDSLFADIGLGVRFDSVTGKVDESTVFGYSIAGINVVGRGTVSVDGADVSGNLYDLLGALAAEFESGGYTYDKADALFGHFQGSTTGIRSSITELGAKTSYLGFMQERMKDQVFNLEERQVATEGVDPATVIIQFESQKIAYNAALQMGSQLIQPSIFDFMR